jgi:hypothetical protein
MTITRLKWSRIYFHGKCSHFQPTSSNQTVWNDIDRLYVSQVVVSIFLRPKTILWEIGSYELYKIELSKTVVAQLDSATTPKCGRRGTHTTARTVNKRDKEVEKLPSQESRPLSQSTGNHARRSITTQPKQSQNLRYHQDQRSSPLDHFASHDHFMSLRP